MSHVLQVKAGNFLYDVNSHSPFRRFLNTHAHSLERISAFSIHVFHCLVIHGSQRAQVECYGVVCQRLVSQPCPIFLYNMF